MWGNCSLFVTVLTTTEKIFQIDSLIYFVDFFLRLLIIFFTILLVNIFIRLFVNFFNLTLEFVRGLGNVILSGSSTSTGSNGLSNQYRIFLHSISKTFRNLSLSRQEFVLVLEKDLLKQFIILLSLRTKKL